MKLNLGNADVGAMNKPMEKPVICECGSTEFKEVAMLIELTMPQDLTSKFLSNVPYFVCNKCGAVPKELMNNSEFKKVWDKVQQAKDDKGTTVPYIETDTKFDKDEVLNS